MLSSGHPPVWLLRVRAKKKKRPGKSGRGENEQDTLSPLSATAGTEPPPERESAVVPSSSPNVNVWMFVTFPPPPANYTPPGCK